VLKLGGILKIHFLFDSGPIGVDGCAPKLQRFRDLARRTSVSNQLQHFQFTVGQTVNRTWDILAPRYSLWVTELGGFSLRSAALRLFKVESDINGILPAGGGPLPFISFLP